MLALARSCFAIAAIIAAQFCFSPASANGLTDFAHLHAGQAALPPIGWGQFCNANPGDCVPQRTVRQNVALSARGSGGNFSLGKLLRSRRCRTYSDMRFKPPFCQRFNRAAFCPLNL